MTGCVKETENKEPVLGGWEVPTEFETYLPMEAADLFYKATIDESELAIPIALLGK